MLCENRNVVDNNNSKNKVIFLVMLSPVPSSPVSTFNIRLYIQDYGTTDAKQEKQEKLISQYLFKE